MPPRISRTSIMSSNPRTNKKKSKKSQSRALNAFAIASHSAPDRIKIRQHRLGESDVGHSHRKRQREDEDDNEEEEEPSESRRRKLKKVEKGRFDELDIDEGSDSEGNTWQMGHVDEDEDSDIDSDEAFGESDEERFEGWTFRGSTSGKGKPKKKPQRMEEDNGDIDLDEGESGEEDDEDDESLGEDAVDLATMLDQYEEEEDEKEAKSKRSSRKHYQEDDSGNEPSSGDDIGRDGASDLAMSENEDEESEDGDDPASSLKLKSLISSLQPEEEPAAKGYRQPEVHESAAPTEFGVSKKVDIESFKRRGADAEEKKKALKLLRDDIKPSKRNDIARKLDAPLPKRQQDKLDRAAASEKANETLGRWVDTVKHNRRAEHISFPLKHKDAGGRLGEKSLMPTTTVTPTNDLESTIQSILQESGLSEKNAEEQIQKWEELQTNKLPLEEVQARRAELQKARELLFREEVRAKRIKKIKSKAYRRVHRKERERLAQRERDALVADRMDVSEEEREHNDRRRAEERMGAKHKDSKWAKGVKKSGKALWDDDARAGVTEMARRNEELRRRIEGKGTRGEDDEPTSDLSSDNDEDIEEDEHAGNQKLRSQLGRLSGSNGVDGESKLGSMLFMQRAEAARKARNDEDIERIRRELAGEETQSEEEEEDDNAVGMGRRKFGPQSKPAIVPAVMPKASEFEEQVGSDEDEDDQAGDVDVIRKKPIVNGASRPAPANSKGRKSISTWAPKEPVSGNPYLTKQPKTKETSSSLSKAQDTLKQSRTQNLSQKPSKSSAARIGAPDADGWQTVHYSRNEDQDDDAVENEGVDLDFVLRNQSLTAQAFAGDDVEAQFNEEKQALIQEEGDQVIDDTLPGWGTWAGDGLSKRAQSKNKGKVLRTVKGLQADKRSDKGLDRVIINEKRIKKNVKYQATSVPFPFETREQYERSLRLPYGPDWNTKKNYQDSTKPRVLLKQGVIRPMAKPLV